MNPASVILYTIHSIHSIHLGGTLALHGREVMQQTRLVALRGGDQVRDARALCRGVYSDK